MRPIPTRMSGSRTGAPTRKSSGAGGTGNGRITRAPSAVKSPSPPPPEAESAASAIPSSPRRSNSSTPIRWPRADDTRSCSMRRPTACRTTPGPSWTLSPATAPPAGRKTTSRWWMSIPPGPSRSRLTTPPWGATHASIPASFPTVSGGPASARWTGTPSGLPAMTM